MKTTACITLGCLAVLLLLVALTTRKRPLEEGTAIDARGLEAENLKLREELEQARADRENYELLVALYRENGKEEPCGDMPVIKGVVAGIYHELNIVLLSVGSDDRVKPGYEFTIYRKHEYVATVRIDKVEKEHCSGYSKVSLERIPIEVGDKATTRF